MTITQLNTARYHGLNLTDMQLMLLLAEHGPLDISDLAERIGLTQAAISVAGKRLIAKHLIHVADRRHDLLRDRQLATRQTWRSLEVEDHHGAVKIPGPPIRLGFGDWEPRGPSPAAGADNAAIFAELGIS